MESSIEKFTREKKYSKETLDFLSKHIETKTIKKGTVLQKNGDTTINAFYVKKGLLRTYIIDEKGREHIFTFAPEGWLATDVEVLTKQASATLFIDALEDSEIEVLGEKLFTETGKLSTKLLSEEVGKLIKRINTLQKRILMLMSYSALDRYEEFLKTYPQIVQRVPQKMIASYLGITPESLSKIRSKK
ncbi:MAG: Crp/Fnr family transcriptional regulator [Chitinophagales bacterium]